MTEGNGLPLAFLVTAANGSEVTVYECRGLRADPANAQLGWLLTKVTTGLISGGSFAEEGFSHPYPRGS